MFLDDFHKFAELCPNFAEEYLYPDQIDTESYLETPAPPAPNGFCTDFTPDMIGDRTNRWQKKLN